MARILISGSSGLVGRAATGALRAGGHEVTPLVRSDGPGGVLWDPESSRVGDVSGHDAIVHLAGEGIAHRRWSAAQKRRIRDSRVEGTRLLARAVEAADPRPGVFVAASAIGIYGARDDEVLTEESPLGAGFLADVGVAWEAASKPLASLGVRLVHLRIGIVLSREGGALAKMLTPFRLGAGGVLGDGSQWMSWISRADLVRIVTRAVTDGSMSGAYNAVAPNPVTNREFTRALGLALKRPTILPLPAFAARLLFGREFADSLLLASARVVPERLVRSGFEFEHADIDAGLAAALTESGG